ncbi:COMPASS (complex proteins associated with Set1p) component [Aspergillus luchuensis]|uniref:COMPASS (Complex proteins associated with Set1p) component n=1 Tax=Aspergillus kawachii TaxID=1069201 RepID=A0A7R7W1T2_ASPKA|nr:COMPASS (complex proteins associated with Set1p) component [Aspergillus luchuensis]BCR94828.1 COMPASS (complex proteins associated with Set1p) component [Aspergillus luchuensis]
MADDNAATATTSEPQPQLNPPPPSTTSTTTTPFPPQNQQPQPHPHLNPEKDKIMASDSAANTPGADSAAATPSATTTTQVRPGGAPIRRYMNEKIVPHLLDGMTVVAKEQCVYHDTF